MSDKIPNPMEAVAKRIAEAEDRYLAAAHAMQTGVAFTMEADPSDTMPKHLRVGVNSALVDSAALAWLLIEKGIITEVAYKESLARFMELERDKYVEAIAKRTGKRITLV